jgi:hypothetical protein
MACRGSGFSVTLYIGCGCLVLHHGPSRRQSTAFPQTRIQPPLRGLTQRQCTLGLWSHVLFLILKLIIASCGWRRPCRYTHRCVTISSVYRVVGWAVNYIDGLQVKSKSVVPWNPQKYSRVAQCWEELAIAQSWVTLLAQSPYSSSTRSWSWEDVMT